MIRFLAFRAGIFSFPSENDPFRTTAFGQLLETPFGPAAGPHSQMAQNIVAAWLCGARYIELKTVQTLDVLNVSKPCIDMEDEGYNVEWSQELKIHQSFDEYLRAWVLIHALHHRLGFPGRTPGMVFNLSVGYDLAGHSENQYAVVPGPGARQFGLQNHPRQAGRPIPSRCKMACTFRTASPTA